jgi:hypothetical protein
VPEGRVREPLATALTLTLSRRERGLLPNLGLKR